MKYLKKLFVSYVIVKGLRRKRRKVGKIMKLQITREQRKILQKFLDKSLPISLHKGKYGKEDVYVAMWRDRGTDRNKFLVLGAGAEAKDDMKNLVWKKDDFGER